EPHVRDLVRDDRCHGLARTERGGLRVGKEIFLAECDRAGVFHRSGSEGGDADNVEFAEWVLDAGELVVEPHFLLRRFEGERGERKLVRGRTYADGNAIGDALAADEIANEERDEVRGHLRRWREPHRVPGRFWPGRVRYLRPVRNR